MGFSRVLNLKELIEKKSFFLFGPRSTGKSTLARTQLAETGLFVDLLDGRTFLRLSSDPSALEELALAPSAKGKIVVIDEVQKAPALLDQVHRLIEKKGTKFLLTGSSARKLRSGAANLLAGRAWEARLFPLVYPEIPDFDLEKVLRFGSLPQVALSPEPAEELAAYVQTYLREEIQAEGFVRKIPQFSRFLKVAALSNSQLMNYSSIGSDCAVSASTVREYFSILEDTLVGFNVEPWVGSKKRKAIQTAKFYFFDLGVTHTLAGREVVDRNSDVYGQSFEQWIGLELRAYLSYRRSRKPLAFWRSVNGQEVDFLIGEDLAIEAKSSTRVGKSDLRGLKALREEGIAPRLICVSHDPLEREVDGIECLPWRVFIERLWADGFEIL